MKHFEKIRFGLKDERIIHTPGHGPGFGTKLTDRAHKDECNKKFAEENEEFRDACAASGCQPTARQAGKWRRQTGLVWKYRYSQQCKDIKRICEQQ